MAKIIQTTPAVVVPEEVEGIQVNSCEKPACANFGVPPLRILAGNADAEPLPELGVYGIRRSKRSDTLLRCGRCRSEAPIRSNRAVCEEMERLGSYLKPREDPARHSPDCGDRGARFFDNPDAFRYNGATPSGKTDRYECRTCRKSFTVGASPLLRQRNSHLNKWVFKLLVNKVPFRRICEMLEIDTATLHRKFDFLHRQCMAFVGDRERRLLEGNSLVNGKRKPGNIYVAVDRQEYLVDWKRRNGPTGNGAATGPSPVSGSLLLEAVGSADIRSGYVFGMHLNFDPDMETVDDPAHGNGGLETLPGYREFARVWMEFDSLERTQEDEERASRAGRLPGHGMPVRGEYTMYAHLFLLKRMFRGIDRIRFYMDCETSIRAACHAAFAEEIREGRFEGFFVNNQKGAKPSQKRRAFDAAVARFEESRKSRPGVSPGELRMLMLREAMEGMVVKGVHRDRCLLHPFPGIEEAGKEVCHFNDTGRYDGGEGMRDHLAWLYGKASLRAVGRFFDQLRRRVALTEPHPTPIPPSLRTRTGYSPHNPAILQKAADIFRVFYNYVEAAPERRRRPPAPFHDEGELDVRLDLPVPEGEEDPETGKAAATPAMRFGLAKAPVRFEDIIYYRQ